LPQLAPGEQLAQRFTILRFIARGGMGAVYEANDTLLRTRVALKVLQGRVVADAAAMERFRREALLARRVSHPNVCRVYELYQAATPSGDCHFLTMEFLEGGTLSARLAQGGPMSAAEALPIVQQMCDGLAAAHAEGVIHRDFKSGNVLLVARPGDATDAPRVSITDFGIARAAVEDGTPGAHVLTMEATILGTPEYMAPEQVTGGEISVATDVYALGIVLYEMVTGRLPFSAATPLATAARRLHEPAPTPELLAPELDARFTRVILRCLEREPEKRFQRMQDVREALSAKPGRRKPTSGSAPKPSGGSVSKTPSGSGSKPPSGSASKPPSGSGPKPPSAEAGHPSIAVLPFVDMSPERDQGYFSDGVAQEIINALAQVPGLHVAARSSSFSLKQKGMDLRTVGQKLAVAHVLEGSVRKAGNRLRVTAQLVGAADGYQLWSQSFDSELADVFTVQDEIAAAVVAALKMKVLTAATPRKTTTPAAYAHYLRGVQLQNTGSLPGLRGAIEEYDKALAIDETYAPAHARLAQAALAYGGSSTEEDNAEWMRRAVVEADRAVELDPDGVDGLVARGNVRTIFTLDWAGARADLDRAVAVGPGDARAHRRRATLLYALGRLPEAVEAARTSVDLDPVSPDANYALGHVYNLVGEYGLARQSFQKALETAPDHALAGRDLGITELLDGQPEKALQLYERHPQPWIRAYGMAMALHSLGRAAEARASLDTFAAGWSHVAMYQLGEVYAWRGEPDAAFEWLERARKEGDAGMRYIRSDPLLRSLHKDPRFRAFLLRLKLPVD